MSPTSVVSRIRFSAFLSVVALTGVAAGPSTSDEGRAAASEPRALPASSAAPDATLEPILDPGLEPLRGNPAAATRYRPARSAFLLEVDGEVVAYETMAVVALPGTDVRISVGAGAPGDHRLLHGAGAARSEGPGRWVWTAPPGPGIHALRVEEVGAGAAAVHLNVLVAHPRGHVRERSLHGYRIGRYRETPLDGNPAYLPPDAFVEVAPRDEDVLVAPHFTLGQFLCKQPGERRFVSLSPALLRKLEAVLQATNDQGWTAPTFHVMSGYRTPAYNRAIGNTTDYSRHLWGDAADIFLDVDRDGEMDDLNGDGRRDTEDARILYGIVDQVERGSEAGVKPGGLAVYRRNAAHGPFVHVDARGAPARW